MRDERFRGSFERLLLADASRDLPQGWQLAQDLGRPAAPLLWEMLLKERASVGPRLVLLAGAVVAGGPAEDERLFGWLNTSATMLEERVLACLVLAMGPRRSRPMADYWPRLLGPSKQPQPILVLAARLAAARFPGSDVGFALGTEDDPGLAAAAAFARLPVRPALAARLWNLKDVERHAELFWRAEFLAAAREAATGRPVTPELLERAREVMGLPGDHLAPARATAALLRARAGDLPRQGGRPPGALLPLLASEPEAAVALQAWLPPVPQPLDAEPARLAVAFVWSRSLGQVLAERATFGQDPAVRTHIALALAMRLCSTSESPPIGPLPGVPEWFFVRWAGGEAVTPEVPIADPQLAMAAQLAVAGRLPRAVARTTLEDALWRFGSHPHLGMLEEEHRLVRDLLLLGSRQGGKYAPNRLADPVYRPSGIDRDHRFFDVAVPLYDLLSRPRLPMPPEHRLR